MTRLVSVLRRPSVLRLLGLAVTLLALAAVVRSLDLAAAGAVIGRADVRPLVLVLGLTAGQFVLRAMRWQILLAADKGRRRPDLRGLLAVTLIAFLANAVLPARLGEGIKAVLIARRWGYRLSTILGTVLLERSLDTATLALITAAAARWLEIGGPLRVAAEFLAVAAVICLGLLFTLNLPALSHRASVLIGQRLGRIGRGGFDRVEAAAAGLDVRSRRPAAAMAGGISLATWLGDALTVWLCATALGLPLALPAAMFIASAAVLATAIPAAPGFVGTFELAVVAAGGAVGLGASTALALAVVMHLLMLVPASLAGGLLMARSGLDLGRLGRDAGAEPLKTPLESA